MTQTIENPTIILPKESDKLIKESFKKKKSKKRVNNKKTRKHHNLNWLNEI
ncbi:hypothetical protein [Nautilia sp.]